jgi:membrane protein YqaA with SNARE-associated domain
MPTVNALFFASLGNILAIIVNYFIGYWLYEKTHTKLEQSRVGSTALKYGYKYGYASLFLSSLPIIGDPITLVAGVLKLNFFYFLLIGGSFRFLRYYILVIIM